MKEPTIVHPYIPNSVAEIKKEMLAEIGVDSVEELYEEIPNELRLHREMRLPAACASEYELRRHVEDILAKNKTCCDYLSFLGGGCAHHYVPAVCDEINGRGEFLTAYASDTYTDFGKLQAQFEYQSMVGELVGLDAVSCSTYDWGAALSSSLTMATRITGRTEVIIPHNISPERLAHAQNFCKPWATIIQAPFVPKTGEIDMARLAKLASDKTAAIYFETPTFLGMVETQAKEIVDLAHRVGALSIVGVDPISLGVLEAPGAYGADIVCGDLQPLGIHMNYGGGCCGFFATRDEEKLVAELPTMAISITPTSGRGKFAFADCAHDQTSYVKRDKSFDYTGTTCALWAITAGVYLALAGPQGMRDIGVTIMEKERYAAKVLTDIDGVELVFPLGYGFQEVAVRYAKTEKTVEEINRELLDKGIFGGLDLRKSFPELGNTALYCFTEMHAKNDIDKLAAALREVVK